MGRQTTVKNGNTIRFGSGKVEVGETENDLRDLGAMRDVQFEETWESVRVTSDNAGVIDAGIREHRAAIAGGLMEVDLENLHVIRGGLDKYEEETGDTEEDVEQKIESDYWSFDTFIPIEDQVSKKNINIKSVEGNDTSYTEGNDEDYIVTEDGKGNKGIIVFDTETTDSEHKLTITYDYDPVKAKILKSGGRITLDERVARITNYDEDGKAFEITVFAATSEEGINIELQGDEEEDPAVLPIRLEGTPDGNRDKGEQLFKIRDEQGV